MSYHDDTLIRPPSGGARIPELDGWRAISIMLVMAGHMLPLGPKSLQLNAAAAHLGMAIFFCLSGFLITQQLWSHRSIGGFLIRRLFRIVPLAYLGITIALIVPWRPVEDGVISMLFLQNYLHGHILPPLAHYWSLCVEVHFYLSAAVLMLVTRFRGFAILPLLWIGFTMYRALIYPEGKILTHLRIDELLAGSMLGMLHLGLGPDVLRTLLARMPIWLLAALTFCTVSPAIAPANFMRGTLVTMMVGRTLFGPQPISYQVLRSPRLRYIAEISFALYVFHPLTQIGWFSEASDTLTKASKRLLSIALTVVAAHLSTFWFERYFTGFGRSLSRRFE